MRGGREREETERAGEWWERERKKEEGERESVKRGRKRSRERGVRNFTVILDCEIESEPSDSLRLESGHDF